MVFPLLPKHYLELASFPKRIPYPVVPWQQEKKQSSKTSMSQMISLHPPVQILQASPYLPTMKAKTILRLFFPSGAGSFDPSAEK